MPDKELFKEWDERTAITGMVTGPVIKNGKKTGETGLVIFVPKKKPLSQIPINERIPRKINGMTVDVQEQIFRALAYAPPRTRIKDIWVPGASRTARYRPAPGGVSVGHYLITAGTLGVWCYQGADVMILSNNHVLANENDANIGDPIEQPGPYENPGHVSNPANTMALLADFIPIAWTDYNQVDCALASPLDLNDVDWEIADLCQTIDGWQTPLPGMNCTKSGRTTSVTVGVIAATDGMCYVNYSSAHPNVLVTDQIFIYSDFIAGGDSGSLLLLKPDVGDPTTAIGLCFAGGTGIAIANQIQFVVQKLGINFSQPVSFQGRILKGGYPVHGAKVFAFDLTSGLFIGYCGTDSNGLYTFPNSVYKNEQVIVFAQYTGGIKDFGGSRVATAYGSNNIFDVTISEYTPTPDGLICNFKLFNPNFLNGDMTLERYLSVHI